MELDNKIEFQSLKHVLSVVWSENLWKACDFFSIVAENNLYKVKLIAKLSKNDLF